MKLPTSNAFTDSYHNPDGTTTAVIYAAPIHRLTPNGWQDLDPSLHPSDNPAYAAMVLGDLTSHLAPTGTGSWNTVSYNGRSFSFALQGTNASPGQIQSDGRTLAYPQVLPGVDLLLAGRTDGGVKETLILNTPAAAPLDGTFAYALKLDGLDATVSPDGYQVALSEQGTGNAAPVMHIKPAIAIDASGRTTFNCTYRLATDHKTLWLTVDPQWLASAAYPVVIDPTVTSQPNIGQGGTASGNMATMVQAGQFYIYNFGNDIHMRVGTWNGNQQGIPFLRFNLDFIPRGATITNAQMTVVPDGNGME